MPRKILLVLIPLAAIAYMVAMGLDAHLLKALAKPLPMFALILLVSFEPASRFRNLVLAGFICSLVGDVFLLDKQEQFLLGLVYFLVAHLFYIAAFLNRDRRFRPLLLLPFALCGALIFFTLRPHLGNMLGPVIGYITIISVMCWRAAAMLAGKKDACSRFALAGAAVFMLSDSLLAFNRFGFPFAAAPYLVIFTYWLSQSLIARAVRDAG